MHLAMSLDEAGKIHDGPREESVRPPAVFRCFPSLKKSGNVRSSIWCLCSLCWLYERLRKNGTLKED